MKVTITSAELSNESVFVSFSTDTGQGRAYWQGPPPKLGATYFTELDSTDAMVLGKNALALEQSTEELSTAANGITKICGELIMVTDEGTGIFRIGDGQIELDIEDPTAWTVGQHYRLELSSITLFDENY